MITNTKVLSTIPIEALIWQSPQPRSAEAVAGDEDNKCNQSDRIIWVSMHMPFSSRMHLSTPLISPHVSM